MAHQASPPQQSRCFVSSIPIRLAAITGRAAAIAIKPAPSRTIVFVLFSLQALGHIGADGNPPTIGDTNALPSTSTGPDLSG
jgi:hypothetical protein